MSEAHTLFVSRDCRYCELFIKMANDAGIYSEFRVVNVHTNTVDLTRVKSVPTLIADHQSVLTGRDAFAWLQNKIKESVQPMMYSDGKNGFDSMSSTFSFIEGNSEGIVNSSMSCVYSQFGDGACTVNTPVNDQNNARTDKARSLDDAMARFQQERDVGIPQPVERR